MPLASTIVGDIYTGAARAKVQGYLSSVWGISAVTGPLLGAFLIAHAGWPTIFWLNVPFGILCIVRDRAVLPRTGRAPQPHRIDYAGSLLLAGGIGTLMFVLVMLGNIPAHPGNRTRGRRAGAHRLADRARTAHARTDDAAAALCACASSRSRTRPTSPWARSRWASPPSCRRTCKARWASRPCSPARRSA